MSKRKLLETATIRPLKCCQLYLSTNLNCHPFIPNFKALLNCSYSIASPHYNRQNKQSNNTPKMPTLSLFTNVPVDAVVASDILKDATKAVAKIVETRVRKPHFYLFSSNSVLDLKLCDCRLRARCSTNCL